MELDTLKNAWQKVEPATTMNNEQIKSMLQSSNNGALQRLLNWERIGIRLLIGCLFMFSVVFVLQIVLLSKNENSTSMLYIYVAYMVFALLSLPWQCYKVGFLKKIDVVNMSMVSLSKAIASYRRFIAYEMVIGLLFFSMFIPATLYYMLGTEEPIYVYVFFGVFFLGLLVGALLLYKHIYGSRIKQIRRNLKEAKEFGIE